MFDLISQEGKLAWTERLQRGWVRVRELPPRIRNASDKTALLPLLTSYTSDTHSMTIAQLIRPLNWLSITSPPRKASVRKTTNGWPHQKPLLLHLSSTTSFQPSQTTQHVSQNRPRKPAHILHKPRPDLRTNNPHPPNRRDNQRDHRETRRRITNDPNATLHPPHQHTPPAAGAATRRRLREPQDPLSNSASVPRARFGLNGRLLHAESGHTWISLPVQDPVQQQLCGSRRATSPRRAFWAARIAAVAISACQTHVTA